MPVGTGVGEDFTVAVGARVVAATDGVALGAGASVALTLPGALQDTTITASNQRCIAGR